MTPPRRPIVNLYCDFDGTLSPLPAKTTQQEQHAIDCHLQPKSVADCYTLDRQRPNLLNMRWSSELIALMRDLINHRFVRWHWLTSNTAWTDIFDGMFGFDSNLTTTEELLACHNGHVSMAPGGKAGIIRRAIHASARTPEHRAIAWLDDDYWPGQPDVDRIDQLAKDLQVPVLLITPDATVGVTRTQTYQLIKFILMQQKPIGLTAIS